MDYDYWTTANDDEEMQLLDDMPKPGLEAPFVDEDSRSTSVLLREMRHESFQHQVIRAHHQNAGQQLRSVKIAR